MIDFLDITYLQTGNLKQQRAHQTITKHRILEKLAAYNPVLVGTIPIGIDTDQSDLDIICQIEDKETFRNTMLENFELEKDFSISENATFNSIKSNFILDEFEFEVFAQPVPYHLQNGFRHMLIEHRILMEKGETFRAQIIELKNNGYKTEPAFAKLLGLSGDPYQALLNLE